MVVCILGKVRDERHKFVDFNMKGYARSLFAEGSS